MRTQKVLYGLMASFFNRLFLLTALVLLESNNMSYTCMYELLKSFLISASEQKYEGPVVLPNTVCCVVPCGIVFHSDVNRDSKRTESPSGPSA